MSETKKRNPAFLSETFSRTTAAIGSGGPRELPRSSLTFTMEAALCTPGVFEDDFDITIRSTTTAEEESVGAEAKGAPHRAGKLLALKMLHAVNGQPLDRSQAQDEWLWEALGQTGRNVLLKMIEGLVAPGDDSMGKAMASRRLGA
jgi:hypothetical protein